MKKKIIVLSKGITTAQVAASLGCCSEGPRRT